jgi:hypothetical protein
MFLAVNSSLLQRECIEWAHLVVAGEIDTRACKQSELVSASGLELWNYIKNGFEKDYAERRVRLNSFKRAFVGTCSAKKEREVVLGEMFTKGDSPCARRWDSFIRVLGGKEKDGKGLPRFAGLLERLRGDGICSFVVEDGVGQDYLTVAGCLVARTAIDLMLEKGGRRALATEERKNFLATSILGMMYGSKEIMALSPEEKLGIFASGYFLAEDSLDDKKTFNEQT